MKKIEAVIQLSKLNEVQDALEDIGVDGMTAYEVKGIWPAEPASRNLPLQGIHGKLLPMIKIDFVVADEKVEQAVKAVIPSAKTGSAARQSPDLGCDRSRACIDDLNATCRAAGKPVYAARSFSTSVRHRLRFTLIKVV